jgi:hypothetical protein
MRHVPHDIEAGLEGALDLHGGDNTTRSSHRPPHLHGEGTMSHAPDLENVVLNSSSEPHIVDTREGEEDGWVSDQSFAETAPAENGRQQGVKGVNTRASRRRRIDRHRSSIHTHHHSRLPQKDTSTSESSPVLVPGPSAPTPDVSSLPTSETPASLIVIDTTDEESRGRALAASAPSTLATRRRPRHMRIVSLRGSETASRDVSPARSIRWADAGVGPSSATSRWPQSPSASAQGSRAPSPGPSTPGEPTEDDLG